jgi:hypothetical protein
MTGYDGIFKNYRHYIDNIMESKEKSLKSSRYLNLGDYFLASSRAGNVTAVGFIDVGERTFDGQNLSVEMVFQPNGYC